MEDLAAQLNMAPHELVPFVKAADGDLSQAAAKVKASRLAREEYGKLTMKELSEFFRAPAGRSSPSGCMIPLEDMKGDIHRDNCGRPVVLAIGMQHGTAAEMQKQYAYLSELLDTYRRPDDPHGACIVIEVRPRDAGAPPSFRFPDRDCRTLFDMGRDIYPEALYTTTHFCGLPRAVTWAFKLVRPFMRREAYDAMVLRPSFAHLVGVMPRASMLRQWGGDLDFDIDSWVEWRAAQEGVPPSMLCPRQHGRAFDPAAAATASEDAMADSLRAGSLGARALLAGEVGGSGAPPRLHGVVEKRGSGRGMFGSVRWKSKLLAVCADIGLVYFDDVDGSTDANKAARIVPLGEPGTTAELRTGDGTKRPHQFALVVELREYLFAASTAEEASQWVAALEAEIKEAQKTRLEMSSGIDVDATASSLEVVRLG